MTGRIDYGWIGEAWRLFSAQMGVWISATLIFFAPTVVFVVVFYAMMWSVMFPGGFPPAAQTVVPGRSAFPAPNPALMGSHVAGIFALEGGFGLLLSFWSAFLYGGLFRMAVRQVRGLSIELRDTFRGGPLFGRMMGALFLLGFGAYGLEALCLAPFGLVTWRQGPAWALIAGGVPGVTLMIVLLLALTGVLMPSFALMADGDGVITALKRSVRAMKSVVPAASGFVFVLGVLVYASEIPCGLGLLATIPMLFLICALAYRDMLGMPDMAAPPALLYAEAQAGVWPPPPTQAHPHSLEERN